MNSLENKKEKEDIISWTEENFDKIRKEIKLRILLMKKI